MRAIVTRGHFRSRGKDGSLITAIAEKHANFAALCDHMEPDLLPIKVLHSFYDLDLDSMTFIYEHDPYPVQIYRMTKSELSASRLSKVIVLQADRHTYAIEIIYHAASRVVINKINFINSSPRIQYAVLIISTAPVLRKLIFAVLNWLNGDEQLMHTAIAWQIRSCVDG